ncbi:cysteine desulfurase NifS [Cereibacter sphaeroides]|uniref:cysteine desulfurase NifS n=1 Tax=Cereibacter sphaeroides TaxID=1063 RepID=UPI001F1938FF|nr:cysteine desulfurase NifS [Cereibacter sphaeroides]MCE6958199.1 cysteine desulfurase NifS [Cereibacter sphaeroides]MCE6967678.1 cysteine desulfurase NifS [Cereibacter sphaeroides]MCE6972489.1 cysteine desulfurase NifS [Cereibacter sphaeroides]
MDRVYLDNNATTRLLPEVLDAMMPFLTGEFGNPSSMHAMGRAPARAVAGARRAVQELIGAEAESEIVFTSGGSEADATAIRSALAADPARREIVTSTVEHAAVLGLCDHLERHEGIKVHRIGVDAEGRLDIDAYRAALSPRVGLVTLMWANNETGTIFPVEGLAELAHGAGALFHTDAVQAVGKVPVSVRGTDIDMLSMSAHKLHGPKGAGALYLRKCVPFQPLIRGGKQERGRRAGTENIPAIAGFGRAAELALEVDHVAMRLLRDRLEQGILARIPKARVLGDLRDRLPNTSCIAFDFAEGEAILMLLDRAGICVSSGAACASGSMEPSHVIRAMKVPFTAAHGAIRFSLSRETTAAEIDRVIEALPPIVAQLRALSPFGAEEVQ